MKVEGCGEWIYQLWVFAVLAQQDIGMMQLLHQ